ncbi:peptidoglycan DD-metalloendopeptidase family protein [Aestuariimicrobium sp. p3-SID1156]|uniref:M23 family metallopeptidase n=1 Tax=Aestuariimicrobium sp. p3-SID1156 TaxID=2916038 RepID=UPI00223C430F|nr:peptidoglycan DD-metalloendopeptidase family protein [Aestuariimicrobium sp. p3-SID1156]MCT1458947.1 peptidoglycan DD-metalloendopeptidase family protein [Aestuariimicrobium sp. p3-SID1156]
MRRARAAVVAAASTLSALTLGSAAVTATMAASHPVATRAVPAPEPIAPHSPSTSASPTESAPGATGTSTPPPATGGAAERVSLNHRLPAQALGMVAPPDETLHEDTEVLNKPKKIEKVKVDKVKHTVSELLAIPSQGAITSRFGMRFHPVLRVYKLHTGTDFGSPCGTPVGASAPGTVTFAGWGGGYGIRVVVDHGMIKGHHVQTSYNHLEKLGVHAGQKVETGDGLGLTGNTGYSTGCHLHFEVIVDGQFTDPEPWLNGRAVVVDLSRFSSHVPGGGLRGGSPSPSGSASASASTSPSTRPSTSPSTPQSSQQPTSAPTRDDSTSPESSELSTAPPSTTSETGTPSVPKPSASASPPSPSAPTSTSGSTGTSPSSSASAPPSDTPSDTPSEPRPGGSASASTEPEPSLSEDPTPS